MFISSEDITKIQFKNICPAHSLLREYSIGAKKIANSDEYL